MSKISDFIKKLVPGDNKGYQFSNGYRFPSKEEFRQSLKVELEQTVMEALPKGRIQAVESWKKPVEGIVTDTASYNQALDDVKENLSKLFTDTQGE